MSEYRLEMRDVSKSFPGVKALDKAQLKLRPGTVHALMGENGAGKSTLMKCMFGIYKMDEGEIIYEGQKVDIHDPLQALKLGIAMVHQELQPIPERSVAENIYVGRYPLKRLLGFIPVVPPKSNRIEPWEYNRTMYKRRNEVERLFRRLKGFRRIFSRFEKLDVMFTGFICFALIADGLR